MRTRKSRGKLFAFTALLFEKSTECISLITDLLKGDKSIEIKINKKGR